MSHMTVELNDGVERRVENNFDVEEVWLGAEEDDPGGWVAEALDDHEPGWREINRPVDVYVYRFDGDTLVSETSVHSLSVVLE